MVPEWWVEQVCGAAECPWLWSALQGVSSGRVSIPNDGGRPASRDPPAKPRHHRRADPYRRPGHPRRRDRRHTALLRAPWSPASVWPSCQPAPRVRPSEDDKLVYVRDVLRRKLLESKTLQQQAAHNTPAQFAGSPDLDHAITDAIMASHEAHTTMSTQALNSPAVQKAIKDILLNFAGLYEGLRGAG